MHPTDEVNKNEMAWTVAALIAFICFALQTSDREKARSRGVVDFQLECVKQGGSSVDGTCIAKPLQLIPKVEE